MKRWTYPGFFAGLLIFGAMGFALPGVGAQTPDPVEIMKQAHLRLYYPGDDAQMTVSMTLRDKRGKERLRRFVMLRKDLEEGGRQKYYTYFLEPSDIRGTSFMVWKEIDKDDARWIYVPAIDLVRRISAKDKGSSFVGSDFSYEDVSGRLWTEDEHTFLRRETLDGREAYVIESVPKERDSFSKKITWVGIEEMLPLKEEYYDRKGKLERVFVAEEIEMIEGHPTIVRRSMTNVKKNHATVVVFENVRYDTGISEGIFTERYLKAPPAEVVAGPGEGR